MPRFKMIHRTEHFRRPAQWLLARAAAVFGGPILAGAVFVAVAGAANAADAPCPADFRNVGEPLTCACAAQDTRSGEVWGDGVYTADSRICRAARHAGAVSATGGTVTILPEAGQDRYDGTIRNGVMTNEYGSYWASFRFDGIAFSATPPCPANLRARDVVGALICTCDRTRLAVGEVWGSNPYTADSALCRAALHSGVIDRSGGTVRLAVQEGKPGYRGSSRNGVTTSAYDDYDRSFWIEGAAPADYGRLCPDRFTGFAAQTDPLSCLCTGEATQGGDAWGDLSYTSDSSICRAALHAGAVGPLGGDVRVTRVPGLDRYPASARNSVTTLARGAWPFGFMVEKAPKIVPAADVAPTVQAGQTAAAPKIAEAADTATIEQPANTAPATEPVPATAAEEPLDGPQVDRAVAVTDAPAETPLAQQLSQDGGAALYITFASASDEIDPAALPLLTELLAVLQQDETMRLALIGHTDSQGSTEGNDTLSSRRAAAVRDWLVGAGIAESRLSVSGKGESEPIASNDTEDGRTLNRRVQAVAQPFDLTKAVAPLWQPDCATLECFVAPTGP